jgi:hypothetical protein
MYDPFIILGEILSSSVQLQKIFWEKQNPGIVLFRKHHLSTGDSLPSAPCWHFWGCWPLATRQIFPHHSYQHCFVCQSWSTAAACTKRDSCTRFSTLGFFHQSTPYRSLIYALNPLRIWLRISRDIRCKSRQNRLPPRKPIVWSLEFSNFFLLNVKI